MAYTLKIQARDLSGKPIELEPAWWKYKELLESYPFQKELSNGFLNYHMKADSDTFLNIFLDQLSYLDKGLYANPKWQEINANILDELKLLIEHPERYSDLKIIVYEWEA